MSKTRERILDVAVEVLGRTPDAGMGDIAEAAGVVRRTIYGHFPSRSDLVSALTERAVGEMVAVLVASAPSEKPADVAWVDFVTHLWPLAHRYRVLVELRRGEFGQDIHTLLEPVESALAKLVRRGQDAETFGRHLAPEILSRVAWSTIFTIADDELSDGERDATAAAVTSLLLLGVPEEQASRLAGI